MIHALGQSWHPEHFVCTHCKEELGSSPFFERNGLAYCSKDYHHLFSPRCAYCAAPITDVSEALPLPVFVHEVPGHAVQLRSFLTPLCVSCFQKVLTAMNKTWHPEHFFCSHCGEVFGAEGRRGLQQTPREGDGKANSTVPWGQLSAEFWFSALSLKSPFHT